MRGVLVALALVLAAGPAAAQSRPSTLNMSCGEARGLVASRGPIVLSTGRHTYDRYVASPGFCDLGQYAYAASVPTADARRCHVGFECRYDPPFWRD